ncbi:MAG: LapA family protein [Burkholderiales bacterium]|nr:LapA family protein [Burkholderiales bacterium]MDE2274901.1 LapA family protein [Burkholderiales bacterium]
MQLLVWLVRAFVFFTLFAFALNNLQTATVHWFFGVEGHAPMVIVVLVAFSAGCAVGVLAMVPSWWRHRRVARRHAPGPTAAAPPPPAPSSVLPSEFGPEHPPREGL